MINEVTDQAVPQIDSNDDAVVPQTSKQINFPSDIINVFHFITTPTSPLTSLSLTELEEGMYWWEYMYIAVFNEGYDAEAVHGDQEIEYPT